jgi:hypothetical protein
LVHFGEGAGGIENVAPMPLPPSIQVPAQRQTPMLGCSRFRGRELAVEISEDAAWDTAEFGNGRSSG